MQDVPREASHPRNLQKECLSAGKLAMGARHPPSEQSDLVDGHADFSEHPFRTVRSLVRL